MIFFFALLLLFGLIHADLSDDDYAKCPKVGQDLLTNIGSGDKPKASFPFQVVASTTLSNGSVLILSKKWKDFQYLARLKPYNHEDVIRGRLPQVDEILVWPGKRDLITSLVTVGDTMFIFLFSQWDWNAHARIKSMTLTGFHEANTTLKMIPVDQFPYPTNVIRSIIWDSNETSLVASLETCSWIKDGHLLPAQERYSQTSLLRIRCMVANSTKVICSMWQIESTKEADKWQCSMLTRYLRRPEHVRIHTFEREHIVMRLGTYINPFMHQVASFITPADSQAFGNTAEFQGFKGFRIPVSHFFGCPPVLCVHAIIDGLAERPGTDGFLLFSGKWMFIGSLSRIVRPDVDCEKRTTINFCWT